MKIVTAMEVKLTQGEAAFAHAKGTNNLEAYLKDLRGREHLQKLSKDDNMIARKLLEEAIALDPDFPSPYVGLAYTYMVAAPRGWSDSPKSDFKKAFELAQKALALDDSLDMAHALLGRLYSYRRQYEKGISEGKKAIALGPGNSGNMAMLAITLRQAGMSEEAVKWAEKAVRINPRPPLLFMAILGYVYADAGRYEDAIKIFKKVLQQNPNYDVVPVYLPAVQMLAGHEKEGRAAIEELLKKNPKLCVKSVQTSAKRRLFKSEDIYAYLVEGLRKAGLPETPPLPLPDKPSIAVLPFVNMSGDPKQEYFSDGIAEEIITALSKVPKLFVIARHSSFTYKGKPIWVPTLGRELGVRYVLEGSVRRAANKVRITAQLIDAKTNHHLWAERYDRDLKDVFAVQDDITKKIITSLQVKLTEGEQARVWARGTNNLQAYLKVLKARDYLNHLSKERNALARNALEEAIALDPNYAVAYELFAGTYWNAVIYRWTSTPKKCFGKCIELAKKATALDESLAGGYMSLVYGKLGQHEKRVALAERDVALNPNSSVALFWLGTALNYSAGKHEEAIAAFNKAIRLDPVPRLFYLMWLAVACRDAGRYDEAIPICRKILQKEPDYLFAHTCLASCYALMGRDEEARAEAAEVLRIQPKFSVDYVVKQAPYKYDIDRKRLRDSLLKAGLPH
jgi:TolB-like protein/Tfp pilus assembly protein PilF